MSGLTRKAVEALRPEALGRAAAVVRERMAKIEPKPAELMRVVGSPGGTAWTGQAGDAARDAAWSVGRVLQGENTANAAGAGELEQAQGFIEGGRDAVRGCVAEIEGDPVYVTGGSKAWDCGEPFEVADDFSVHVKALPSDMPWDVRNLVRDMARDKEADLRRKVAQLEELGQMWGGRIARAMDYTHLALNAKNEPFGGYDPHKAAKDTIEDIADGKVPDNPFVLRDQWGKLNDDEKNELWRKHAHIGDLDGIPATDKDRFNRATLERETGEKKQELQRILDEHKDWNPDKSPSVPGTKASDAWNEWKDRADAARADLQKNLDLQNAIKPPLNAKGQEIPGQQRYLLQHDKNTTRTVVSAGNPDTAKNVATFVPGTTEHADHLPGSMNRIDRMFDSAVKQGSPREGTAVVAWFGYDAPDWVGENNPSSPKGAEAGAPLLDRFQDGLRATHEGDPAHATVVGHSYGSTVVGEAASHGRTLNADDVIYLGSPGVEMQSPSDLRLAGIDPSQAAQHTWAAADKWDPVPHADIVPVVHAPFGIPIPALPGTGLWPQGDSPLGPAPTSSDFHLPQSQIIPVDPHPPSLEHPNPFGAHSQYWDNTQGKDSALTTMGKIISGASR